MTPDLSTEPTHSTDPMTATWRSVRGSASTFLDPVQRDTLHTLWSEQGLAVVHLPGAGSPQGHRHPSSPPTATGRLLAVADLMGVVYGYRREGGSLVQLEPVVPGGRSWAPLPMATTMAFARSAPDFVALLSDPGATGPAWVGLVTVGEILTAVSPTTARSLWRPAFRFSSPPSFGDPVTRSEPTGVFTGSAARPRLRIDRAGSVSATDAPAAAALGELFAVLPGLGTRHRLDPGDIVVIDNRRAAHAVVLPTDVLDLTGSRPRVRRSLARTDIWSCADALTVEGVVAPGT